MKELEKIILECAKRNKNAEYDFVIQFVNEHRPDKWKAESILRAIRDLKSRNKLAGDRGKVRRVYQVDKRQQRLDQFAGATT